MMMQQFRKISQLLGVILTVVLLGFGIWNFNMILVSAGIISSIFMGRFFCGWFCPMGTFSERVLTKISKNKPPHKIFNSIWFRYLFLFLFFVTLVIARLNFASIYVIIGMMVFVGMMASILALFYQPRSWCGHFCPWGTIMALFSFKKRVNLKISADCKDCRLCSTVCNIPSQLNHSLNQRKLTNSEVIIGNRCITCMECVEKCPTKKISLVTKKN